LLSGERERRGLQPRSNHLRSRGLESQPFAEVFPMENSLAHLIWRRDRFPSWAGTWKIPQDCSVLIQDAIRRLSPLRLRCDYGNEAAAGEGLAAPLRRLCVARMSGHIQAVEHLHEPGTSGAPASDPPRSQLSELDLYLIHFPIAWPSFPSSCATAGWFSTCRAKRHETVQIPIATPGRHGEHPGSGWSGRSASPTSPSPAARPALRLLLPACRSPGELHPFLAQQRLLASAARSASLSPPFRRSARIPTSP